MPMKDDLFFLDELSGWLQLEVVVRIKKGLSCEN
jgi:hypothetical protein